VALVLTGLSLSGCGLLSSGDDDAKAGASPSATVTSPTASGSAGTSPASPSGTTSSTATPSSSTTADSLGDPVKTVPGFVDNAKVTLDVFAIRRTGDLAVIQLKLNVDAAAEGSPQVAQTFGDGSTETGAKDLDSMDGVQLVDAAAGKVYLAATNTDGGCLCSEDLGGAIIEPGQSTMLDVTFAAPPDDLSSIDVRVPSFGTIPAVPVQ
jgi:hypothetical protein